MTFGLGEWCQACVFSLWTMLFAQAGMMGQNGVPHNKRGCSEVFQLSLEMDSEFWMSFLGFSDFCGTFSRVATTEW